MNRAQVIHELNRLLSALYRSLPVYLQGAQPWTPCDERPEWDALARMADDHRRYARRVADAVLQQGGRIDVGQFPIEFTSVHDLSLNYLVGQAAENQRRDVEMFRECVAALAETPRLRTLAEDVLGNAEGHLRTLEGLKASLVSSAETAGRSP